MDDGYMREFTVKVYTRKPLSEADTQELTREIASALYHYGDEHYLGHPSNPASEISVQGEHDNEPVKKELT